MDNENIIIQQLKGINRKLKILLWFLLVTFIISTAVIPLSMSSNYIRLMEEELKELEMILEGTNK